MKKIENINDQSPENKANLIENGPDDEENIATEQPSVEKTAKKIYLKMN